MSENVTELSLQGDRLRLPATATPAEAAAVAAALGAHLQDQETAAANEAGEEDERWDGKRFAFAGRLDSLGQESRRVPQDAPTDRWTAAGRTDRY